MTLAEVINASHTDDIVIYEGYHGDKQLPVAILKYGDGQIPSVIAQYGNREVCIIEAVDYDLHIWIDEK